MNSLSFFGEAAYRREKAICDYRELRRMFERPSYMTPEPTTFPKAEIGICGCGHNGTWYHKIIHLLP